MYDDIQNIPIIIDFGLSRDITPLLSNFNMPFNKKLVRNIFINYDMYDYWCVDIYMLSNIVNNSSLKWNEKVTEESLKRLLRGFFTPNFMTILTPPEITQFKKNIIAFFSHYLDTEKTWQDMFRDLIQTYKSWDNYAVAITYLYTHHMSRTTAEQCNLMQQYFRLIKDIVIALPNKRPTAEETREHIMRIYK
jgi:hypothetical protein